MKPEIGDEMADARPSPFVISPNLMAPPLPQYPSTPIVWRFGEKVFFVFAFSFGFQGVHTDRSICSFAEIRADNARNRTL